MAGACCYPLIVWFSLLAFSLAAEGANLYTRASHCRLAPSMKCPGRDRLCPSVIQEMLWGVETIARQAAVRYDPCLTSEYGGIPLMDRSALNTTNAYGELLTLVAYPKWWKAFGQTMLATKLVENAWENQTSFKRITRLSQFNEIYEFFMNHYGDGLPTKPQFLWRRDNATDPRLSKNQRWNDDDVFAQERLAGINPVQIERVVLHATPTSGGVGLTNLMEMLNDTFDWNEAVRCVVGCSMKDAVRKHILFVLRFPLLSKVRADSNASGAYKGDMMTAPVALFAATNNRSSPFKPVAIQLGDTALSPVYTPRSGYFWWTVAKMYVNNADGLVAQIANHLVDTHLVSEVFAVAAFRHMRESHPVHSLLRPHFHGLIGINTQGFDLLTSPHGAVTKLAGIGHSGMLQLMRLAYQDWTFDKTDFDQDLQERGFSSTHNGKLLYYPYRDDGHLLYRSLKSYVDRYVEHYYCTDNDVQRDQQLQNWATEVSEKHRNKGFPQSIKTISQLENVLLRIIWTNSVHHAAVNYPVKEFGSHIPTIAYTLFKKPSDWAPEDVQNVSSDNNNVLVKMLPSYEMAKHQAATATQLSALRFTDLLSYGSEMDDDFAKQLAARFYDRLTAEDDNSVQSKLESRNKLRRRRGVLPYRYMQPKQLPNSIAI